jgi:hypothetical protein
MTASECAHEWVAGMMVVADEDLDLVAAVRAAAAAIMAGTVERPHITGRRP